LLNQAALLDNGRISLSFIKKEWFFTPGNGCEDLRVDVDMPLESRTMRGRGEMVMKTKKEEYIDKMAWQFKEWSAKIDELESKYKGGTAYVKSEYESWIKDLRDKRDAWSGKFQELRDSSGEAWETLTGGVDHAWQDFKDAYNAAWEKFKKAA
jgi:hypothetical protein